MSFLAARARRGLIVGSFVSTFALGLSTAQAHILTVEPKPRDQNDEHKNDAMPCPRRTATQPVTTYEAGAEVMVKFNETTNHPGCFAVDISAGNDTNWMMLGTMPHSTMGRTPRPYQTMVKLPAGMTCEACTLRVRQFMTRVDPPSCPPMPIAPGETYYQCSNIVIKAGAGSMPDAGAPDVAPAPSTPDAAPSGTGGMSGTGGSGGSGMAGSGGAGGTGMAGSGGAGGSGGRAGSGGSAGRGGSGMEPPDDDETGGSGGSGGGKRASGGCSFGGTTPAGGLMLLAAVALLVRRRRR